MNSPVLSQASLCKEITGIFVLVLRSGPGLIHNRTFKNLTLTDISDLDLST